MMMAPLENGEQRITVNQIRPRMMVKLAKQIKNRVKFDVVPDSNDETRIEIAKATSKFLKYWWEQTGMDRKTRDIFLNNGVKGWCAAKVYFDAEAGQDITPGKGNRLRRRDGATIYRRNTMPYMRPTYVVCIQELKWMRKSVGLWKESHVTLIISKNGMGKMCRQMRM